MGTKLKLFIELNFRPLATGVDVGEDLALLAACNHSIISYGTFGMWAAILAGGEVTPLFSIFLIITKPHLQVVTSSTMARTKEGGELKAAKLANWLVLEEESNNPGQKNLGSKASAISPLSYLIIVAYLLLIETLCANLNSMLIF